MRSVVSRGVVVVAGVWLLVAGVRAMVSPLPVFTHYDQVRVVVLAALFAAALVLANRLRPPRAWIERAGWVGPVIVGVLSLGVGIGTAYEIRWDPGIVVHMAGGIEQRGSLSDYELAYLSTYPNNGALFALCRLVLAVTGQVVPSLILLNALMVALCARLVHVVLWSRGARRMAVVAQGMLVVLVGFSPWVSVPYTDALTAAVPLLPMWLLSRPGAQGRRRLLMWMGVAVALGLGIALKSTLWVLVASAAGTLAIAPVGPSGQRRARQLALAAVLTLVATATALGAQRVSLTVAMPSGQHVDDGRARPALLFLDVGLKVREVDGVVRYGTYDGDVVHAFWGKSTHEMTEFAKADLRDQLERLGARGVAGRLSAKALWNWGDGMFWAYGEGDDHIAPPLVTSPPAEVVRAFNGPRGALYPLRTDVAQAVWLLILLGGGVALLRVRPSPALVYGALTLLGALAFTTLFEGRSRYLFVFVPLVIATTALAWVAGRKPGATEPGQVDGQDRVPT